MKAIQFTIDEELLRRVDRDAEAKKGGRSAFLRRAIEHYLAQKRARAIRAAYQKGYGDTPPAADEFTGGDEAQAWPDE